VPETSQGSPTRADRILDAAGSLLLRHGYRKVNVEDIARQAGIGKGTTAPPNCSAGSWTAPYEASSSSRTSGSSRC
jgi:hypothetical protein